MPRIIAVRVEPPEVEGMVKTLLTVYAARAEALAEAAGSYLEGREGRDAIREAQRELADTADALDTLGWTLGARMEPAELAGPPGLVREVLYAALLDAAEGTGEACVAYEAAETGLEGIREAVARLTARLELFASHEERERR
jgi:hypothetical protein